MKHLFILLIALLFCVRPALAQSGRKLPYPVIFVHGWTGDDRIWYDMAKKLRDQGLNVSLDENRQGGGNGSRIDFHLNADGNRYYSKLERYSAGPQYGDVADMGSYINPNNDVFLINFDVPFSNTNAESYSNQAATVKQGFAIGLAVRKVLQTTGADKVILFGHSMGGLAIREYLQNQPNWLMGDGQHHVAKLITTGTPHGGSNSSLANILAYSLSRPDAKDERSEAVRDLRYPKFSDTPASRARGTYLWGGNESDINRLGLDYYNNDVDCNGYVGGEVQGLNQKDLYLNTAYACVVGTGVSTLANFSSENGDGIVEADRATILNLGYRNLTGETFYANTNNHLDVYWHTKLPKQLYQNLQALDEPSTNYLAYEIKPDKTYSAFFSPQANSSLRDVDRYKVYVNEKGIFGVATSALPAYPVTCQLLDENGVEYGSRYSSAGSAISFTANVPRPGWYYLSFEANTFDATVWSYAYSLSFQAVLDKPVISASISQTICSGQSVTFQGPPGYTSYRWFKDGVKIQEGDRPRYEATISGNYSLIVSRSSVDSPASDLFSLLVRPSSAPPTIAANTFTYCVGDVAQPLSASGTQVQWYTQANGGAASGTAPAIVTSTARTLTYYVTQTVANGCESTRLPVTVNVTAPPAAPVVSASQFVCQFSKPVSLTAQGQNLIWRGAGLSGASETAPLPTTDKVDTLRYTVTQRLGSCISQAAPVTVTVRKAPEPPAVVTPVRVCIDSPPVPLTATGSAIRWYIKADRSENSSSSLLPPTNNSGQFVYYATQTDANKCESLTNPVNVTVKPKPTALLPKDTIVYRYDSLAVQIALTGDAPWRVTLWNGRELTATQSPLLVYVKPTATTEYALQSVKNECGTGSTGRAMRITLVEPLAISTPIPDNLLLVAYPTPTEGALQVEWVVPVGKSGTLQLITLNGQVIWQRQVRGTGFRQTEPLSLQTQAGGRYLLQLTTPSGVLTRQILKQ